MERKAPLPPLFWNKNAPKAPNGGVSRVGNQLVRMRSRIPSLKDMETGTAPARHFLTPARVTQPKRKKQEAGTPAPCFFIPSSGPTPAPALIPPCPAGHTSDAIPTGPAPRACQPIGGGLHGAEPTFGPALCQRTDNRPGPTRGGPPIPRTPASPL